MFKKIIVPVDLAQVGKLGKALRVAGDMAREHGAELCFVGVTASTPSAVARTPEEYKRHLADFAAAQETALGVAAASHALISHDPAVDMDRTLQEAVEELGGDLVVMATHLPNVSDYVWSGHGAHLAAHSNASVMLVRG